MHSLQANQMLLRCYQHAEIPDLRPGCSWYPHNNAIPYNSRKFRERMYNTEIKILNFIHVIKKNGHVCVKFHPQSVPQYFAPYIYEVWAG